jgi:hypothetical protein
MLRHYCLVCGNRCERDEHDLPRCKGCGDVDFCSESCRDEHLAELHPEIVAADADPVTDAEYEAFWLARLPQQRSEFERRFGFAAPRRVA